jgi:hypothetical protein
MSQPRQAPPPVVNAVRLMLLRSAVSILGAISQLATQDDLKRRYLRANPDATTADAEHQLELAVASTGVILAFYVFLAFQVRKGAGWARVVTFAIAGLGVLGAVLSLGAPDPPLSRVLGVAVGLIDIAVVILLAVPNSGRYFRGE